MLYLDKQSSVYAPHLDDTSIFHIFRVNTLFKERETLSRTVPDTSGYTLKLNLEK